MSENVKKGKGLLSKLAGDKTKKSSCCCGGYEIEEIPEDDLNGKDNVNKQNKKTDNS